MKSMGRGWEGTWQGREWVENGEVGKRKGRDRLGGLGESKWAWKQVQSPKLVGCEINSALFPFISWKDGLLGKGEEDT